MIEGTAAIWIRAITEGKAYDQDMDTPRIRKAFVTLAATRTTWPAPLHFVECLPPREQLQLTRESRKADPERAAAAMAEVESLLTHGKGAAAGGE